MAKPLNKDEIRHIASLAKLEFSKKELDRFEAEFNSILDYISMIGECDTSDVEFEHHLQDFKGEVLADDMTKPSLPREKLLKNATHGRNDGKYIRTSKIVNKE